MVTEISFILGLTLIQLVECFGIILTVISLSGVFITAYFLRRSLNQKTKFDSAVFVLTHINDILKQNKTTVNTLHERKNDKSIEFQSEHEVKVLLGRLENVIFYINEKTIQKEYALKLLRITLKLLKEDTKVQEIITNMQKEFPTAYVDIQKFMKNEI